jgi:hypothetical protein
LACAFGVGAVAALFIDAALQNALAAVRSPGAASITPWWVIGRVLERSVWVAFAAIAWLVAPAHIAASIWPAAHAVGRAAAFDAVGRAMIAVPLVWLLALWLVSAVRLTLTGSWAPEGGWLLSNDYVYNVLVACTPWLGGGVTLLTLKRHF